jgi:hypothetical protein
VSLAADEPFVTFFPDGTASEALVRLTAPGDDLCLLRVEPLLGRAVVDEKTSD